MRPRPLYRPDETFEQWRQRMLDETSRFIEWGLAHPDEVRRIPTYRVGAGGFSKTVRDLFWHLVVKDTE